MSVNTMNFEQSSSFLMELYKEATGQYPTLQITNTADFTSVATTLLQMGYDPIIGAITQVIDKTIFSIRPYSQKFKNLQMDEQRWGSVTRKINFVDKALDTTDERLNLVDGQSIDHYEVKKPTILQTSFYGSTVYSDHITIFKDQLESAFSGPEQFGRFMTGVMQNIADKLTQIREAEARGCLANFIIAKYGHDTTNAINVLQEYYNETGTTLTPASMFAPANMTTFSRWLASYMQTLTEKMSERSLKYHQNVTGKEVMRHTEDRFMEKYLSANIANNIEKVAMSNLYNAEKLDNILTGAEKVTFWQNIDNPYSVQGTSTYMKADGTLDVDGSSVLVENIVGCLFDRDALGMVTRSTWSATTPMNCSGGYWNTFYHFTQQVFNDFTENFVLLYAGTVTP